MSVPKSVHGINIWPALSPTPGANVSQARYDSKSRKRFEKQLGSLSQYLCNPIPSLWHLIKHILKRNQETTSRKPSIYTQSNTLNTKHVYIQ
jgi:hypothetical protein